MLVWGAVGAAPLTALLITFEWLVTPIVLLSLCLLIHLMGPLVVTPLKVSPAFPSGQFPSGPWKLSQYHTSVRLLRLLLLLLLFPAVARESEASLLLRFPPLSNGSL